MPRFRNDSGSVLHSQEFGAIPIGEFDAEGYDPEVHGVIPGCVWLDPPEPEAETTAGEADNGSEGADTGEGTADGAESDADGPADPPPGDDPKAPRRRGKAADKESGE